MRKGQRVWRGILGCVALALLAVLLLRATGNEWWKHHKVTLNWKASTSAGVVGYHVYRKELPNGEYVQIIKELVEGVTFADEHVKSGREYRHCLRAFGHGKLSECSEPVDVKVP